MKFNRVLWNYLVPSLRANHLPGKKRHNGGFTLTEILVSVVIAAIIMSGLMTLMVELLTSDARETARTETQREIQMALEYISADIREAVFVYDGNCLDGETDACEGGLFNSINVPNNSVPVLAFWKLEDLPDAVLNGPCAANQPPNNIPCLSRRTYSLIIYYLTTNEGSNTWSGMARLQRAAYRQFDSTGGINGDYVSPMDMSFETWPGPDAGNVTIPSPVTLVDFVEERSMMDLAGEGLSQINVAEIQVDCPPGYNLTPSDKTLSDHNFDGVRNFYACILDEVGRRSQQRSAGGTQPDTAFNQRVILFLRGNAAGKPGIRSANEGFMPAIQTQVLNRSVRQKSPRRF